MSARLLAIILLLASHLVSGKEYPKCQYTYFKNGTISTSHCYDTNGRWGRAKAFNAAGKEIYDREIRRFAGHSSVDFSFYESGAVRKAFYSSAPDGGIQWYRTTTWFSEDGRITEEIEDNYDKGPGFVMPKGPGHVQTPKPAPKKPAPATTAECAVIYSSEFWLINTSPYSVIVTATRKYSKSETYIVTLRPRQTLKGGQSIGAQIFEDPAKYFDFSVKPLRENSRQRFIVLPSDRNPENTSKEVRRYYFDIRRII